MQNTASVLGSDEARRAPEREIFLHSERRGRERQVEARSLCQFGTNGRSRTFGERQERTEKAAGLEPAESMTESSILAQNERWRRVLSMQVERMPPRWRKRRTGE